MFEGFRDATLSARVSAREARVDPGAERADLDDVRILFREEVRGVVELEAPRGTIHLYSEDFELSGGVRGWTEGGERFATDARHYERERQRIWSDTPVQLDRQNFVMEADGMEIELADDVRRIRLLGRVRGVMEPQS